MSPDTLICVPDPSLIRCRSWDEFLVVYDSASSSTHLLEQPAGFLLEWLVQQPLTIDRLTDRLCAVVAGESREVALQYVQRTTQSLHDLGLLSIREGIE